MSQHPLECPCQAGLKTPLAYADCCGRWHGQAAAPGQTAATAPVAPDAQALMRSRYSAYALGRLDYLLATWHASTRPPTLEPLEPGLRWIGLELRRHEHTAPDEAVVEFVARSKLGGKAHRLHETSRFVREAGRWWYVDGQVR